MRIGLAIVTYSRLDILLEMINALIKCRGLADIPVHVVQDGGPESVDCSNFMSMLAAERGWTIRIAPERLGLPVNYVEGVNEFVVKSNLDAIIGLADDVRVSKDFLEFMTWSLEHFKCDPDIGAVSAYSREDKKVSENEISFRSEFNPIGWGKLRKNWDYFYNYWLEEGFYNKRIWCLEGVRTNALIKSQKIIVYPRQSRSTHIGWYGTNLSKEEAGKIKSNKEHPVHGSINFKEDHKINQYRIREKSRAEALKGLKDKKLVPFDKPFINNLRSE